MILIAVIFAFMMLGFFAQIVRSWVNEIKRKLEKRHIDEDDQWVYEI